MTLPTTTNGDRTVHGGDYHLGLPGGGMFDRMLGTDGSGTEPQRAADHVTSPVGNSACSKVALN